LSFTGVAPFCISQLMKVKLTVVFRTARHWSASKIDAVVFKKMWAIECSGLAWLHERKIRLCCWLLLGSATVR